DYYYPSIAANPAGDVVIGYSRSGASEFASGYASVGATSGGTLSFGSPILLKAGSVAYTGARWGDFSATTLDPADPGIFWTTQEFAAPPSGVIANNNWATQATEVIPTKAGEVRWQATGGGAFATGGNWYNGAAPGPTDHAIFSRAGTTYTVDF